MDTLIGIAFLLIILFACFESKLNPNNVRNISEDDNSSRQMRIISYNVLHGGEGCGEDRLVRLQKWFRYGSQDADEMTCPAIPRYDFAAFNECNGWQKDMERIAKGFGFPHYCLLKAKTGYHIGFMSRFPFDAEKIIDAPFHHGRIDPNSTCFGCLCVLLPDRTLTHPQVCWRFVTATTTSPSW